MSFIKVYLVMIVRKRIRMDLGFTPQRNHLCTLSGYHDRTIFSVHWSREGIIASGAADDGLRFFLENKDGLHVKYVDINNITMYG
ncbi:hypothetical protein Peur_011686 [Populus x canadensis]